MFKVWSKIKGWFNHAWSIFIARLEVFTGFVIGAIAAIDWSNLAVIDFDAGFSNNQMMWIAIGLVVKGFVSEIGRRQGTVVSTQDQIVPVNLVKKAKVEVK